MCSASPSIHVSDSLKCVCISFGTDLSTLHSSRLLSLNGCGRHTVAQVIWTQIGRVCSCLSFHESQSLAS